MAKPNTKELAERIAGKSLEEQYASGDTDAISLANELMYGVVGANEDTRDWDAIMASDDVVSAARQATGQMYSDPAATAKTVVRSTYDPTKAGQSEETEYLRLQNESGKPSIVKHQINGRDYYAIVSGDGVGLRAGFDSLEQAQEQAVNFGIDNLGEEPLLDTSKPIQTPVTEAPTAQPTQPAPVPAGPPVAPATVPEVVTQKVVPPTYAGAQTVQTTGNIPNERAGTFATPLQTAGLSAVPETVSYKTHYTGTPGLVDPTLTMTGTANTSPVQQVKYENNLGQVITVTEINGQPTTYVPPGFTRSLDNRPKKVVDTQTPPTQNYAGGGQVDKMLEAKYRIATMNGYSGPKTNTALDSFAASSPAMKSKFNAIGATLAKGGYISRKGYAPGGLETGMTSSGYSVTMSPEEAQKLKGTTVTDSSGAMWVSDGTKWNLWQGSDATGDTPAVFNSDGSTNMDLVNQQMQSSAQTTTDNSQTTTDNFQTTTDNSPNTGTTPEQFQQMQQNLIGQTMQPIQAPVAQITPTAGQFIPVDAGQTLPQAPYAEAATAGTVQQAELPTQTPASVIEAAKVTPQVQGETSKLQAAQGSVTKEIEAAQQTTTGVSDLQAAQGEAIMMDNPVQREIQSGELISGVADAEKAAKFTEQVQAAQATPTAQATVQGQLEGLMAQFEGGNTPAWAAGSMRSAMATLSARGLGASSLAGQAVIQAAMESALPIAQMDAQTQAQFESQNLSNRQQSAILAAQQRAAFLGQEFDQAFQARVQNAAKISDVANMNFTAEQQVALENARAANTVNLQNLSNSQAMVMAEAAALSQLDMANLNNRQQAAVQNAQNFLQMDMTNLSNEQQASMFRSQQNIQALFTDQAATNAAAQFNASSENQTNQFFANLKTQTAQFNASQQNAMDQFNINSVNALREFNAQQQQQRDMFNAQNGLVIAQANAQWRQNLDTLNTAAQNESNMDFAKTINSLTSTNLDQIWQRERDIMTFAFSSAEGQADRDLQLLLADKGILADEQSSKTSALGYLAATAIGSDWFGDLLPF